METYLTTQAKNHGFLCYKFTSPSTAGVPDRLLIGHGRTLFVETKCTNGKPRKLQEHVFAKMREHGAKIYVIDSSKKVDQLFKHLKTKKKGDKTWQNK